MNNVFAYWGPMTRSENDIERVVVDGSVRTRSYIETDKRRQFATRE